MRRLPWLLLIGLTACVGEEPDVVTFRWPKSCPVFQAFLIEDLEAKADRCVSLRPQRVLRLECDADFDLETRPGRDLCRRAQ